MFSVYLFLVVESGCRELFIEKRKENVMKLENSCKSVVDFKKFISTSDNKLLHVCQDLTANNFARGYKLSWQTASCPEIQVRDQGGLVCVYT